MAYRCKHYKLPGSISMSLLWRVLFITLQSCLSDLCHLSFLGWQPRWFVLAGGTLSYYDSQEDAWKGCKGSIKISVCEIQGNGVPTQCKLLYV